MRQGGGQRPRRGGICTRPTPHRTRPSECLLTPYLTDWNHCRRSRRRARLVTASGVAVGGHLRRTPTDTPALSTNRPTWRNRRRQPCWRDHLQQWTGDARMVHVHVRKRLLLQSLLPGCKSDQVSAWLRAGGLYAAWRGDRDLCCSLKASLKYEE